MRLIYEDGIQTRDSQAPDPQISGYELAAVGSYEQELHFWMTL